MNDKDLKSLIILFKAYHNVEKNVKRSLLNTEINVNEFAAMEALYEKGELSTQELIDTVLIPNSSMTYVLEILAKKEYIERKKKESDRRVQVIKLSPQGKLVFENIYEEHFKYMRTIFDVLNHEEEDQLNELLKKLGKHAKECLN